MPLTVFEIDAAKPGLRPVRQIEEDEKEQKGNEMKKGKKVKKSPSKGEVSVEAGDSTGNEPDPRFVKTDKPYKMADGGGLYLEVDPSGGKYWRFKYRFPKEKRLSLGVYPEVGLAVARAERDKCREQLAKGIDPGVARKAKKAARVGNSENSFEVVAREWLKTHVDSKAETHRKRVYARFENDVFPYLGSRPIAEITPMELLGVIKKIEDRGAGDTAHRTLGSCGQVFRFGIQTGRCVRDITADLRGALKPVEEQHFAAVTKPAEIGGILRAIDCYKGTFVVQQAFRLAPLVFVRPGELRKAKWQEIDLDEAEWLLELSKVDDSKGRREDVDKYLIVPLSRQAVEILRAVHALTGDDIFVFPGARDRNRPMSENAILTAMRRMGISKEEMCGHGWLSPGSDRVTQKVRLPGMAPTWVYVFGARMWEGDEA